MKASVYVLGNGQLGRMLKQAGEPLGIKVFPIGLDETEEPILNEHSVITAEIERWPDTPITQKLAQHFRFDNRHVFPIIADRLTQKQLLDKLKLSTAPWLPLEIETDWQTVFKQLGNEVIVKMRTGGYDGRGQWMVNPTNYQSVPKEVYGQAIIESKIPFQGECSLVGARNAEGQMCFYPLTRNLHQSGILKMSVASQDAFSLIQQIEAESMLKSIMTDFNYVGVMAMECFILGDQLMINELAPRVHNSGHWTQNGSTISQFELHLRAILNLPMPKPYYNNHSVMINLIGVDYQLSWLNEGLAKLHWYKKEVRPGRKVGHINLCHTDTSIIQAALERFKTQLPDDYLSAIEWAIEQLNIEGK